MATGSEWWREPQLGPEGPFKGSFQKVPMVRVIRGFGLMSIKWVRDTLKVTQTWWVDRWEWLREIHLVPEPSVILAHLWSASAVPPAPDSSMLFALACQWEYAFASVMIQSIVMLCPITPLWPLLANSGLVLSYHHTTHCTHMNLITPMQTLSHCQSHTTLIWPLAHTHTLTLSSTSSVPPLQ